MMFYHNLCGSPLPGHCLLLFQLSQRKLSLCYYSSILPPGKTLPKWPSVPAAHCSVPVTINLNLGWVMLFMNDELQLRHPERRQEIPTDGPITSNQMFISNYLFIAHQYVSLHLHLHIPSGPLGYTH